MVVLFTASLLPCKTLNLHICSYPNLQKLLSPLCDDNPVPCRSSPSSHCGFAGRSSFWIWSCSALSTEPSKAVQEHYWPDMKLMATSLGLVPLPLLWEGMGVVVFSRKP